MECTPLSAVSSTKGVRALLNGSSLPVFGGTTPSLLLASSERGTPATASGSASGTTTSTPTLVRELFVGCKVKPAAGFEDVSDASSGPLSPGDVGTVLKIRTGEENSYQVKSKTGGCWWYRRRAIRLVPESGPLAVGSRVELRRGFGSLGDASGGVLSPGDIGEIVVNDGSSKPEGEIRSRNNLVCVTIFCTFFRGALNHRRQQD